MHQMDGRDMGSLDTSALAGSCSIKRTSRRGGKVDCTRSRDDDGSTAGRAKAEIGVEAVRERGAEEEEEEAEEAGAATGSAAEAATGVGTGAGTEAGSERVGVASAAAPAGPVVLAALSRFCSAKNIFRFSLMRLRADSAGAEAEAAAAVRVCRLSR